MEEQIKSLDEKLVIYNRIDEKNEIHVYCCKCQYQMS